MMGISPFHLVPDLRLRHFPLVHVSSNFSYLTLDSSPLRSHMFSNWLAALAVFSIYHGFAIFSRLCCNYNLTAFSVMFCQSWMVLNLLSDQDGEGDMVPRGKGHGIISANQLFVSKKDYLFIRGGTASRLALHMIVVLAHGPCLIILHRSFLFPPIHQPRSGPDPALTVPRL